MKRVCECQFGFHDQPDLVNVYEGVIGQGTCDLFEGSAAEIDAFESGGQLPLLKRDLADIRRTRESAELAGRFVAKSDFGMTNPEPPWPCAFCSEQREYSGTGSGLGR
jgi:hypothetical protein